MNELLLECYKRWKVDHSERIGATLDQLAEQYTDDSNRREFEILTEVGQIIPFEMLEKHVEEKAETYFQNPNYVTEGMLIVFLRVADIKYKSEHGED